LSIFIISKNQNYVKQTITFTYYTSLTITAKCHRKKDITQHRKTQSQKRFEKATIHANKWSQTKQIKMRH